MAESELFSRERALPGLWYYSLIRKAVMAISGIVLVAFLFGHWNGNLVLLDGERAFNAYLQWLEEHVLLHYGVWIVVGFALISHMAVGVSHWIKNRCSRPVAYRKKRYQATTWSARSMIVSGSVLLLFLFVHIAQVQGWVVFHDKGNIVSVYHNIQAGFKHWAVVSIYLLAQIALAFHLYHGLWSVFQTLGISHPSYNHWRRPFAAVIAVAISSLNISLILLNLDCIQQLLGAMT